MPSFNEKKEIKDWTKGDVIALIYGFNYVQARVLGNNGTHITWSSLKWLKSSALVSRYEEIEQMMGTRIGIEKRILFFSKIKYFTP